MKLEGALRPLANRARDAVAEEARYWRRELERPWREGGQDTPARVGRWIGVGLAIAATVAGVVAALRVERPRER